MGATTLTIQTQILYVCAKHPDESIEVFQSANQRAVVHPCSRCLGESNYDLAVAKTEVTKLKLQIASLQDEFNKKQYVKLEQIKRKYKKKGGKKQS